MKDNAHLYWPAVTLPSKIRSPNMQRDCQIVTAAVVSIERLDGGCLLYRLAPKSRQHERTAN